MRCLLYSLLLFAVAACGGESATATTPEAPLLFLATRAGATYVVQVHPDSGEVVPFGPAAPIAAGSTVSNMRIASDGARVVLVVTPPGSSAGDATPRLVLLGDGTSWTTLGQASDLQWSAADLSLLELSTDPNGTSDGHISIVDTSGRHLFDFKKTDDEATGVFEVEGIAPNGAYFVVSSIVPQGGSDGLTYALYDVASAARFPLSILSVDRMYTTSFTVRDDGTPGYEFVDPRGQPFDVTGFDTCARGRGDLCVDGDAVYRIGDRAIERIATAPSGIDPLSIDDVAFGHVLVGSGSDHEDILDGSGQVLATFAAGAAPVNAPPPGNGDGSGPIERVAQVALLDARGPGWVVMQTSFLQGTADEVANAPSETQYAFAEELWVFADAAGNIAPRTIPLRSGALPADYDFWARSYAASSSGAYLLYVDGSDLHVVSTSSGTQRVLTSDFAFIAVDEGEPELP